MPTRSIAREGARDGVFAVVGDHVVAPARFGLGGAQCATAFVRRQVLRVQTMTVAEPQRGPVPKGLHEPATAMVGDGLVPSAGLAQRQDGRRQASPQRGPVPKDLHEPATAMVGDGLVPSAALHSVKTGDDKRRPYKVPCPKGLHEPATAMVGDGLVPSAGLAQRQDGRRQASPLQGPVPQGLARTRHGDGRGRACPVRRPCTASRRATTSVAPTSPVLNQPRANRHGLIDYRGPVGPAAATSASISSSP